MPASCRIRWARTCTATTPTCRRLQARLAEHSDDEAHPFAGQAKFSLTQAMSSMLALGLSLEQVVPMVTSNAADMLGLSDEIGALRSGMIADVSVLSDECGGQVVAERLLQPLFCLRAGRRYDADAAILPQAIAA